MWPPWKRMTWLSVLLADLMSEFSSHRTTTATGQPFNAAGTVRIKSQTACAVCIVSLETQQSFCQQFGLLICKVFISNRPSAVRRVMFLYRVTSLTACNHFRLQQTLKGTSLSCFLWEPLPQFVIERNTLLSNLLDWRNRCHLVAKNRSRCSSARLSASCNYFKNTFATFFTTFGRYT